MTKRLAWLLAALGILVVLGWWFRSPSPGQPADPPYLTLFLIDGLTEEPFEQALAAGRLPHIQALIDQGVRVQSGITAFPSMTGYAYYPFITGHDAAQSGLLGLRWFDRAREQGAYRNYVGRTNGLMNKDMVKTPKTLYERVSPQHSFSINTLLDRGVHTHTMTGYNFTMAKYRDVWWLPRLLAWVPGIGSWLAPDFKSAEHQVMERAIADLAHAPKVQWVSLTSPDADHHLRGFAGEYRELLHYIDGLIGRYRRASEALGQEPNRIYAVISDHGVVDVHHNLDLRAPLAAKGLAIDRDQAMYVWQSDLTDDVATRYAAVDGTLHVNGNTMNFLYFREPGHPRDAGFGARLTYDQLRAYPTEQGSSVDLIATLAQVEGVEWVVALARIGSDPSVVVTTASGQGIVRKQGTSYAYQASGVDPLGYTTDPGIAHLTDGTFYPDETWLTATHRSAFPDALNRLHALLTSPGCGDLVVTAKAGYDLAEQFEWLVGNYQGGHGGIRADQLRVPYVLAGPGLRSGVVLPVARAEDVGATLGHLLGLQRPQGLSGRVLSQALIPSAP